MMWYSLFLQEIVSSWINGIKVAILYEYKDSKSFLAVLILMTRAILYPGSKLFVTSGGKEQSSGILKEKVEEIC